MNSGEGSQSIVTDRNVVDFLFFAAKGSERILMALVEYLAHPGRWISQDPTITNADLKTSIVLAVTYGRSGWADREVFMDLASILLGQLRINHGGTPGSAKDIRTFGRVLQAMDGFLGIDCTSIKVDGTPIQKWLRQRAAIQAEFDSEIELGKMNRRPRRGRRRSEQSDHRITALLLLEESGRHTKADSRRIVVKAFGDHGIPIESDSLKNLLKDYKTTRKRRGLDAPLSCLFLLGLFFLSWWKLDPNERQNVPDFCKGLLSEDLRPVWGRMLTEFSALHHPPGAPELYA